LLLFFYFYPTLTIAQPIPCGTPYLPSHSSLSKPTIAPQATGPFKVGDPLTVPAYSFSDGLHYQTTTTCRVVGESCYIFVEDDIWGTSRVTQAALNALVTAFDHSTPRYTDRGIFSVDTQVFGPPPNVDNDPRILIVVLDILDSVISGTFIGYYDVANQVSPVSREIVYLDSNPLNLNSALARATLAHEFQHMLHWKADPNEDKWVDEGCSEYAELACGYRDTTTATGSSFLQVPNVLKSPDPTFPIPATLSITNPVGWGGDAAVFLFDQVFFMITYFAEQYGDTAVARLVSQTENSIAGFNRTFEALGLPERFEHFFGQWSAALFLDNANKLGYRSLNVGPVRRDTLSVPLQNAGGQLQKWGLDYYVIDAIPPFSINVTPPSDANLLVTLISETNDASAAFPVVLPAGSTRRIGAYSPGRITLAITRTSGNNNTYAFSITALNGTSVAASDFDISGRVELADFIAFAAHYEKSAGQPGFDPTFDLNGDNEVSFSDFILFARNFGATP
ncbi:MAG: hypothetical protein O2954_13880, partial [bacterium]|nr:hypothetical protein [bacterium]